MSEERWTLMEWTEVATAGVLGAVLGWFASIAVACGGIGFWPVVGAMLGALLLASSAAGRILALRPRGLRVEDRELPSGSPAKPSLHKEAIRTDRSAISFAPPDGLLRPDRLSGHRWAVCGMAVSPAEAMAVSVGEDGMIQAWDLATGFGLWGMQGFKWRGRALAFSFDGALVAAAGIDEPVPASGPVDSAVHILDARTGLPLRRLEFKEEPFALAFLPGRRLLVAAFDQVRLWDLDEPAVLGIFPTQETVALAVPPDGRSFLAGTYWRQEARVVAVADGSIGTVFRGHAGFNWFRGNAIRAVAFSPDGDWAITASNDGTARVWAVRSGHERCRFDGHNGWWGWHGVTGAAWLSDSEALTSGEDGTLRRWDTESGQELARFVHGRSIRCLAVSADGKTALTGASDGSIRVWHFRHGSKEGNRLTWS
ncbi:MAG: WD40 repeat domain-containing protein [Gemmataceae bacterium]|nr:WD40 repeat domain-containing protein [Gemmataceae bacterium]